MTWWLPWASALVLGLTTYFSALVLALQIVSRSSLERRLPPPNGFDWTTWLFDHVLPIRYSVALIRTALRVTFFVLVLMQVVDVSRGEVVRYIDLLIASVITVVLLWVFTVVVASALGRHVAAGLVASALPMLRLLAIACAPLTKSLSFVDEAVRRLTGANLREQEEVEAELLRSIEDTHREGGLDERAAALLENVVQFSSTDVGEVMTPRTDIEGIELTNDLADIRAFIGREGHSRIPVYEENLDNIVGILYVKDLIPYLGEEPPADFQLRGLLRQPIVVPETKPVRELLADFQQSEVHMAIVIDEYGGTAGLVTIEDVLEEIVGEIHDEHEPEDEAEPDLHEIDERRAEVDGRYHLDDLNQRLGLDLPEDEEFDTVAGFMLSVLGRVPEVGESFESHNARFTALAASPTHVERIGVELLHPAQVNGEPRRRNGNGNGNGHGRANGGQHSSAEAG
jgi:CBS domain containing-hemolysin-like protein